MSEPTRMRIVGHRKRGSGLEYVDGLQKVLNEVRNGRGVAPKGVYRFKTHEEADEWMNKMLIRSARGFRT